VTTEIEFPKFYQGIYQRVEKAYRPLLREAMQRIQDLPISADLKPFVRFQVLENPQPSFMLFPLMFLATAEAVGGITDRHRDYLPTIILASELTAVADDAVDRSSTRSGRDTFVARFGDGSVPPIACALTSMVLDQSRSEGAVFDAAIKYFVNFFGLELWERSHLYPAPDGFGEWLDHRYLQGIIATEYILNAALFLARQPAWPRAAITSLCKIGQDVDDIVNLMEYRGQDGENDDLQSGVVTRPLILTLEELPSLAPDVAALWDEYRPVAERNLAIADFRVQSAKVGERTFDLYKHIRKTIIEHGVPKSTKECSSDYEAAVAHTPADLQPLMRELGMAFLDRLRRVRYVDLAATAPGEALAQAG